jgi:hypothetical protein
MNKLALVLAMGMTALLAGAAEAQTSQQNRMGACNALAGERSLSGDARKSFMSDCLSKVPEAMAAPAKTGQTSQQQRMADCNAAAAAGSMSGDARKAFKSDCLKGGGGGAAAASKEQACAAQGDSRKLAGAARTSFVKKCASS